MKEWVQLVGENINYEQDVAGDTIQGNPVWTLDSSATPGLSGQTNTATSAVVAFESNQPGVWVLSVTMTLASGQIKIGQTRITVVQVNV